MANQTPEQIARDNIDEMLVSAGWVVQSRDEADLSAGQGVVVREYPTDVGPADYVLFVDKKPVGVIEAKPEKEGARLTMHEDQAEEYAKAKLKYNLNEDPLPFVYESTGTVTIFTNGKDPKPRSRPVFHFHRPETFSQWFNQKRSLRTKLQSMPALDEKGLRPAQINAISNLEKSFKDNKPRALIQMTMGAGKTFTACTFAYRLLKHADAKRILFLVDTRNLGEQAEQEFQKFQPTDDNRKFTELYNVQRLTSSHISPDSQVCISTIQRLYSILQGKELEEEAEQENPNETQWQAKEPRPVEYAPEKPMEQFDFIIIDECHRSIYNLWRQVLEYHDAFLIGLTATPDKRTLGFFNQNVVSQYSYEEAVVDGVNVPYDVFTIETRISKEGETIAAEQYIERRERQTRKRRWERLDADLEYTPTQLDREVVNLSQIRNIIKAYKDNLPRMFPDRFDENGEFETPKTLVFAKTDSHADDIIRIVREEFGEGNEFCKKITYKTDEDPKSVLNRFRNSYYPRIAVTVDMIATGTDVRPLEVLLFMRDVKSVSYFEQMKGRGSRIISMDDLQRVTKTAKHAKTHFVIVDAVGATRSAKTDSRPLERKPSVPLKDLLGAVTMGVRDEDLFTSLANRLIRLDKQITKEEKAKVEELTGGKGISAMARELLEAYNPDIAEEIQTKIKAKAPGEAPAITEKAVKKELETIRDQAAQVFTGKVNEYIENVRRIHEQAIDTVNVDNVETAEWAGYTEGKAVEVVNSFSEYIRSNKDEIVALSFFFSQPHRRKELTFQMVKELAKKIQQEKPLLAPVYVWAAYERLGRTRNNSPKSELVALVSLVRAVAGIDDELTPYNETVDKNFQKWVFAKQAGALKFNPEQMDWLRMLKEHIAGSFHIEKEDLDYAPFDSQGGIGKMQQIFGDQMDDIIAEMNEALVA